MSATSILPHDPIAPWAEVVPNAPPATVDDLLYLPDDGWQYEVVQGVLVRMAGSGQRATTLAAKLLARLFVYVEAHDLGVVTGADGVYKFPHAETGLLPDVGFYHGSRQSLIKDPAKPIPFAPDFAIEVASPSQGGPEMTEKARVYISNGTGEVWIFWPESAQVDIWRAEDTGDASTYTRRSEEVEIPARYAGGREFRRVVDRDLVHTKPVNHHPSGDMHGVLGVGNTGSIIIGNYVLLSGSTILSSVVADFTLALDDVFPPRSSISI